MKFKGQRENQALVCCREDSNWARELRTGLRANKLNGVESNYRAFVRPFPLEVHKGLKMFVTTGSRQLEDRHWVMGLGPLVATSGPKLNSNPTIEAWLVAFWRSEGHIRPRATMDYLLIIPYPQSHDSYHFEEGGSIYKMQNRYDASYTDYAWMDFLVGTVIATALRIVQWPKPFLVPDTYLLY